MSNTLARVDIVDAVYEGIDRPREVVLRQAGSIKIRGEMMSCGQQLVGWILFDPGLLVVFEQEFHPVVGNRLKLSDSIIIIAA